MSLFVGSVLASTILPGGVEVLLYFLATSGDYSFTQLLITATIGNSLGGIITFVMGGLLYRGVNRFSAARTGGKRAWFKLDESSVTRARKWGIPILLLSWMPVIGDPLCIAGGYLRFAFWPSCIAITLGKFGRYVVLLWLFESGWST